MTNHIIKLLFPSYGNIFYEMYFIKMHEGETDILYIKNMIYLNIILFKLKSDL